MKKNKILKYKFLKEQFYDWSFLCGQTKSKIKWGLPNVLLENEMVIETQSMKIEMKINKVYRLD